jgi:hypothetical protein
MPGTDTEARAITGPAPGAVTVAVPAAPVLAPAMPPGYRPAGLSVDAAELGRVGPRRGGVPATIGTAAPRLGLTFGLGLIRTVGSVVPASST